MCKILFAMLIAVYLCADMALADKQQHSEHHGEEQREEQAPGNRIGDHEAVDNGNPIQNRHPRVKRNWPFRSSQQNADRINEYYQARPGDGWWTSDIQKPFARYVGRAFGDEFPRVRDSIIDHQNQRLTFTQAHMPWTGYHPRNWLAYNGNNDAQERSNPYNGYNQYGGSGYLSRRLPKTYSWFRRNGKRNG